MRIGGHVAAVKLPIRGSIPVVSVTDGGASARCSLHMAAHLSAVETDAQAGGSLTGSAQPATATAPSAASRSPEAVPVSAPGFGRLDRPGRDSQAIRVSAARRRQAASREEARQRQCSASSVTRPGRQPDSIPRSGSRRRWRTPPQRPAANSSSHPAAWSLPGERTECTARRQILVGPKQAVQTAASASVCTRDRNRAPASSGLEACEPLGTQSDQLEPLRRQDVAERPVQKLEARSRRGMHHGRRSVRGLSRPAADVRAGVGFQPALGSLTAGRGTQRSPSSRGGWRW